MYAIENVKEAIKYAPLSATKNPEIRGWWLERPEGDYYMCNDCMSRLMARGIKVDNIKPVYMDNYVFGACICCE